MLNLDEFIDEMSKKYLDGNIPPFRNTHLFYLGRGEDTEKYISEIASTLQDEIQNTIPLPFEDVTTINLEQNQIGYTVSERTIRDLGKRDGQEFYIADRVIRTPQSKLPKSEIECFCSARNYKDGKTVGGFKRIGTTYNPFFELADNMKVLDSFRWIRYVGNYEDKSNINMLSDGYIQFHGCSGPSMNISYTIIPVLVQREGREQKKFTPEYVTKYINELIGNPMEVIEIGNNAALALKYIASISHPDNYILKESQTLTSVELEKIKYGIHPKAHRQPRYIVVDHNVLVEMDKASKENGGENNSEKIRSVTPHSRRGHWRRLAERCVKAKARGENKTWVKESYIGSKDFSIGEIRYQVLFDMANKGSNQLPCAI